MLDVLEREEIELLRRDRVGAMKSQCRSGGEHGKFGGE